VSVDENVIIPFTFGKDSFLTYHTCMELGLNPVLVFSITRLFGVLRVFTKESLFEVFTKNAQARCLFLGKSHGRFEG